LVVPKITASRDRTVLFLISNENNARLLSGFFISNCISIPPLVARQLEILQTKNRLCEARSAEAISMQFKLRHYPAVRRLGIGQKLSYITSVIFFLLV